MNPKLNALFDEPEKRYLNAEELGLLSQYVSSLPERMAVYQQLRDQEVSLLQPVVDTLQQQQPDIPQATLERCVQNVLLILRYGALAMLIDDPDFMNKRLSGWLPEMVKAFGMQAVSQKLLEMLQRRISQVLSPQQMELLQPSLKQAITIVAGARETVDSVSSPLAGML